MLIVGIGIALIAAETSTSTYMVGVMLSTFGGVGCILSGTWLYEVMQWPDDTSEGEGGEGE
jgi:hypothetical protein